MGQDLIISCFAIKKGTNLKKTEKEMLKAVKNFAPARNKKSISLYYDYLQGMPDDESEKLPAEEIRKEFEGVIKETFRTLGYRDVTSFEHKGDTIYLTGGMSWGDDPTESFGVFNKFNALPAKILKVGKIR